MGERNPLLRMQAVDADQRLERVLDAVEELVTESREHDLAEGLDPGLARLLDAIAGAEDAPLEFRSLRRRVAEGRLTWLDFWLRPEDQPGGHRLVNAAMKAQGAELAGQLAALDREGPGPDAAPPAPGGVLGR